MSTEQKTVYRSPKASRHGGKFIQPHTKTMKRPAYSKNALNVNPQQVASYASRKAYKKDFKEISPDTDALIDQCLNPEDVMESCRWPNTYGLSATYKCKSVLNARFSEDNRCCVAVYPDLRNSIFTTFGGTSNGVEVYSWPFQSGVDDPNPFSVQNIVLLGGTNDVVHWNAPIILQNKQALLAFPNVQTGSLLYALQPEVLDDNNGTGSLSMRFMFDGAYSEQASVTLSTYTYDFTLLRTSTVPIASVSNPEGVGADLVIASRTDSQDGAFMSIQINGSLLPYIGTVTAYMHRIQGTSESLNTTLNIPNNAQHVSIYDIKDADTIANSADQAFVLAQSLLITAEMSDLNNGGVLALARVPGATVVGSSSDDSPQFNTWYDWIASLSYNSYDGAVKHGGYSWYLPEDETGYFYRPIDSNFSKHLPYIISEFTVSDNTEASVVRIKVSTIVQFTTNSSIYDCRPSCYISERDFMHQLLSIIPASYSNDGHKEGLKKALKAVGGKVIKLLKNPKTYATVGSLLAML